MYASITNISGNPLTLPAPFRGVMAGGQIIAVALSVPEVQVLLTGVAGQDPPGFRVGALPDNYAGQVDTIFTTGSPAKIVTATTSATLLAGSVLFVDTSLDAVVLSLPDAVVGEWVTIKKVSTDTHEIQVAPGSSASVEANVAGTAFTLPSSDSALLCSWNLVCDGTDWWLV